MIAMKEFQKAVFERLSTDSELTSIIGQNAVFDHLIENENFPYIGLGEVNFVDWSTSSDEGADLVLTAHIWDRSPSRERCLQILEIVAALLTPDLVLQTHKLVLQQIEFAEVRREPNSQDFHGLVRLRAKIEAPA